MKPIKLFLISLFIVQINLAFAQDFAFTSSASFEEPKGPKGAKLKVLSNGNTFLINSSRITLYDNTTKIIAEKEMPSEGTLLKYFEVNQNLIFFYIKQNQDTYISQLIRIVISGINAEIVSKDKLHEFPPVTSKMDRLTLKNDSYTLQGYEISKDYYSDYYAVATLNTFSPEPDKKIEVMHFSPEHKEINRGNLRWPDPEYKNVDMPGLFVNSSEYILLGTGLHNKKGLKLSLSKLGKGATELTNMPIPYTTNDFDYSTCKFEYDRKKNIVYSFWYLKDFQKNTVIIQPYNSSTNSLMPYFGLPMSKAKEHYLLKDGKKKGFSGIPHNLCMDNNGNLMVLMEETSELTVGSSFYTYLEDPVITNFSADGKENYGLAFPYAGKLLGSHPFLFYYGIQRGGFLRKYWYAFNGQSPAYTYHMDMIPSDNYTYLFLNGNPARLESEKVNVYPSFALGTSYAYYYKIDGSGNVQKNYLFGKPGNPNENQFGLFYTSDYDPITKRYAVVKVDRIGAKKTASIVWFKLE